MDLPDLQHSRETALLQAAFRDLHGPRLHGFALVVTLGNRALAARVAARALAEGARHADQLRHPERAAAWLRSRVLRMLPRDPGRLTLASEPERRAALAALGASEAAFDALAALRTEARAALAAAVIEGLQDRDVEVIVGRRGAALRAMLVEARTTYLEIAAGSTASWPTGAAAAPGSIAARVAETASRTLGDGLGTS
jgi:hypothetical protein